MLLCTCMCILFLPDAPQVSVDLSKKIHTAQLIPDMHAGKYIPNLVAKKFNIPQESTPQHGHQSLSCREGRCYHLHAYPGLLLLCSLHGIGCE